MCRVLRKWERAPSPRDDLPWSLGDQLTQGAQAHLKAILLGCPMGLGRPGCPTPAPQEGWGKPCPLPHPCWGAKQKQLWEWELAFVIKKPP